MYISIAKAALDYTNNSIIVCVSTENYSFLASLLFTNAPWTIIIIYFEFCDRIGKRPGRRWFYFSIHMQTEYCVCSEQVICFTNIFNQRHLHVCCANQNNLFLLFAATTVSKGATVKSYYPIISMIIFNISNCRFGQFCVFISILNRPVPINRTHNWCDTNTVVVNDRSVTFSVVGRMTNHLFTIIIFLE